MSTKRKIPNQQEKVLDKLSYYVSVVRYDWATYLALYTDTTTLEILKRAAPPFFSTMRERLRDGVLLSLARLFDTQMNTKQDNLTLYSVVERLKVFADPTFILQIEESIKEASLQAEPIRWERHQRIAHLDVATVLEPKIRGDVSHEQIESLLGKIEAIVDQIYLELCGATYFRSVYTRMANLHVEQLVKKLAVVLAMDKNELDKRLSQLETSYSTSE